MNKAFDLMNLKFKIRISEIIVDPFDLNLDRINRKHGFF